MADYHTFTADGVVPENWAHIGRFGQLTIGKVGAEDFGGGTLRIQKDTLDGGWHTVREITEAQFDTLQDKSIRTEFPDESKVRVELYGSTSPNLYVEYRNQKDDTTV